MRNLILFISLIILFIACKKEEDRINLAIEDIELVDIGRGSYECSFEAHPQENGIQECMIRTKNIKKNDTIKYTEAFLQGDNLTINITSSPYDFDCNEDNCITVHDIKFKLKITPGKYTINIGVNNIYLLHSNYKYNFRKFN